MSLQTLRFVEGGSPRPDRPVPSKVVYVGGIHPLDQLVFQDEDIFAITGRALQELRFELIREAFRANYDACESYRRYCDSAPFAPGDLTDYESLSRIPLLPTSLFKKREIRSVPLSDVAKVCLSSGTQGGQSRVYRDKRSLERLLGSVRQGMTVLDRDIDRDRAVFVLGPDTEEANDLWFAYVLSIVDFLHPTRFYVREGRFDATSLLNDLAQLEPGPQPLLVGPPFLLMDLAQSALGAGRRLTLSKRDGLVITAGGWKRHQSDALTREAFSALVVDGLGVAPSNVRDTFNMVELNSVFFECEAHRKHVPPWLYATARDASTLAALPPNAEGLLAYCDPLSTSFPCFIVTDDLGSVSDDVRCPCGRFGNTVHISRRVARVEARGCALKLDRSMASSLSSEAQ